MGRAQAAQFGTGCILVALLQVITQGAQIIVAGGLRMRGPTRQTGQNNSNKGGVTNMGSGHSGTHSGRVSWAAIMANKCNVAG